MDDTTFRALLKSIQKWKDIEAGWGIDRGMENCALCILFHHKHCNKCPVNDITGDGCLSTCYDKFITHHKYEHRKAIFRQPLCQKCRQIAGEERKFLESLLPPDWKLRKIGFDPEKHWQGGLG